MQLCAISLILFSSVASVTSQCCEGMQTVERSSYIVETSLSDAIANYKPPASTVSSCTSVSGDASARWTLTASCPSGTSCLSYVCTKNRIVLLGQLCNSADEMKTFVKVFVDSASMVCSDSSRMYGRGGLTSIVMATISTIVIFGKSTSL